jgi:GNAT superfamily N-acetyltransferase
MTWQVRDAHGEDDVRRCWPVFRELRPDISSEESFIERWKRQRDEGYRVAFIEEDGDVRAVAGFRIVNTMAWGRCIYLDDLAVHVQRHGVGIGTAILNFVQEEARRTGCESVQLDTGYHRHKAHRAYLRNGFTLDSHHVQWKVSSPTAHIDTTTSPAPITE